MRTHPGEGSHVCPQCDRRFRQDKDLQKHMPVHTGEKPFGCTVCDAQYPHRSSLHYHMKARHPYTHQFNTALTSMLRKQENRFTDFAHAHRYVSELFREPAPLNACQQCPHCGETVADLAAHADTCPWRQGPSWR